MDEKYPAFGQVTDLVQQVGLHTTAGKDQAAKPWF